MADEKLKILCLRDLLLAETDRDHPMIAAEICRRMEEDYGHTYNRKTVYSDVDRLRTCGMKIGQTKRQQSSGYFIEEHNFELQELKLLVDAVQSSKFITKERSEKLKSHSLSAVAEYYGIMNENAHRAKADALASGMVFSRYLKSRWRNDKRSADTNTDRRQAWKAELPPPLIDAVHAAGGGRILYREFPAGHYGDESRNEISRSILGFFTQDK